MLVCGDGKTVNILHHIKDEYSTSMPWLLVVLGTWHLIKDYLKIFLEKYKIAVYEPVFKMVFQQGTLDGIFRVSQWSKTHLLTTLVMEAMRRLLIESFENNQTQNLSTSDLLSRLRTTAQVFSFLFFIFV